MFTIQQFKNCENPNVSSNYDIKEILNIIKYGNDTLPLVKSARAYGKPSYNYKIIKDKQLPSFRYNFNFNGYATNKNIISPSGLIYLDFDNINDIPNSDIIYAKWKSLSTKGFGVIVKVDNLNLNNFSNTYDEIGKQLNILPDPNARKATQQTVLSYDPDLYFNPNSITYTAKNISYSDKVKKVPSAHIIKKGERGLLGDDTFLENSNTLRFNNISDYFINRNEEYLVFKDKIKICEPFIQSIIERGKRNNIMFFHLSQYKMLNPNINRKTLKTLSETINKRMVPKLSNNEVDSIIKSVFKKYEEGTLELILNKERKFLFNPIYKLTREEKMKIVNSLNGELKKEATKETIYNTIETWDFESYGKIIQEKVADVSGFSVTTIKRYWSNFKEFIRELNNDFKLDK